MTTEGARRLLGRLEAIGARPEGISADSRAISTGDLFVAYPGFSNDGRRFIGDALARGAAAVLWEAEGGEWPAQYELPNLPVRGLRDQVGDLADQPSGDLEYRSIAGGLLAQTRDTGEVSPQDLRVVTRRAPSEAEMADLQFCWRVCKFVKSNAIVYARDRATIGIGAGQMSRVYSSRVAAMKASDEQLAVAGAVMASDAFLPFRDGLDVAAEYGIKAVIQPGGSKRDDEVIAAADEHGIAMVFTGMRHFRH